MRLEGSGLRLVIVPESDEEKIRLYDILENRPAVYWGDAEGSGSGLVINGAKPLWAKSSSGTRQDDRPGRKARVK